MNDAGRLGGGDVYPRVDFSQYPACPCTLACVAFRHAGGTWSALVCIHVADGSKHTEPTVAGFLHEIKTERATSVRELRRFLIFMST